MANDGVGGRRHRAGRLRIHRLILNPVTSPEYDGAENKLELQDESLFRAREHMGKVSVVAQAAMKPLGPRVHGVEDAKGSLFWALETDSESGDASSVESLDTSEFIKQAHEVGFTIPQLVSAERELEACSDTDQ